MMFAKNGWHNARRTPEEPFPRSPEALLLMPLNIKTRLKAK
jgi:hypothetical protein